MCCWLTCWFTRLHTYWKESADTRRGIMKANWTLHDYYDMQAKTLPFASEDVELIHNGMNHRYDRAGKTAGTALGRRQLDLSAR